MNNGEYKRGPSLTAAGRDHDCQRCGGKLYEEDGDIACLNCGARQVHTGRSVAEIMAGKNGVAPDVGDPFPALVAVMARVAEEIARDVASTAERLYERREQVKRIEKALAILNPTTAADPEKTKGIYSNNPAGHPEGFTCNECGQHRRSKTHRTDCLGQKA